MLAASAPPVPTETKSPVSALETPITASTTSETLPPTQKVMDPDVRDSTADVILRILPEHAAAIENGPKNYEYRTYCLRDEVTWIWLYEDTMEAIRLVIVITEPKRPGEVNDPKGEGNNDFDRGLKISEYGYPIRAVYHLPITTTRQELRNEYNVDMAKGRQYVKEKLVEVYPLSTLECILHRN